MGSGRASPKRGSRQQCSRGPCAPLLHGPLHRCVPRGARCLRRRGERQRRARVHRRGRRRSRLACRGSDGVVEARSSGTNGRREGPMQIAGAPISWGVCEVPGWGHQLTPERVLAEMRDVGMVATELGPDGFLPAAPGAMAEVLSRHHLQAVGGFTPLLLHVAGHAPVPEVEKVLQAYAATGSDVLVLSAVSGLDGYDARPTLDDVGWRTLLT